MLPPDIAAWLRANQHPGYARHLLAHQESIKEGLEALGIPPSSDIGHFYLHFGPDAVRGWYELNEVDAIQGWTSYARSELGVPECFVALTSVEGQGITLYEQSSGRVFEVEFGQFDKLDAGELQPIAGSFVEFLRWCKAKSEEN